MKTGSLIAILITSTLNSGCNKTSTAGSFLGKGEVELKSKRGEPQDIEYIETAALNPDTHSALQMDNYNTVTVGKVMIYNDLRYSINLNGEVIRED